MSHCHYCTRPHKAENPTTIETCPCCIAFYCGRKEGDAAGYARCKAEVVAYLRRAGANKLVVPFKLTGAAADKGTASKEYWASTKRQVGASAFQSASKRFVKAAVKMSPSTSRELRCQADAIEQGLHVAPDTK